MRTTVFWASSIGAVAAVALGLGGCATKSYVREQVGMVDAKETATQAEVANHQAHLSQLDRTSQEALERAEAAHKLAEGKFLYTVVLSDDSVKFPAYSAQLSPEAKTRLLDLVQKLKQENKNVYLEIQGHTDNTGSKPANVRLGEARAEAVRLFMNQQGVALNRMATISYGPDAPVASDKTAAGRAQNRRVVLVVLA
jgi:outer membrane protein OmpA-like peptidoglycan-associated protein